MIELTSNGASMAIDPVGAEMRSFVDSNGKECIWTGDPEVWKSSAPVLFPSIGFLKDGKVTIEGKPYEIPKHGFVRGMLFEVTEQGDDFVTLSIHETAETKQCYPFDFALSVTYRFAKNGFEVRFTVENHSSRPMPFVLGGHPGFTCPMNQGEQFSDYEIHFEKPETGEHRLCTSEHLIGESEFCSLGADHRTLSLDYAAFDRLDTYIFDGLNSRSVELRHKQTGHGLRFSFPEMEVLALWTMPGKHAPYLCLEPWQGLPACADETGRFEDKPHHVSLGVGKAYCCGYRMELIDSVP
ncbi:MAG: aldose 1-epimerase family protein [Clostridia bacterium]